MSAAIQGTFSPTIKNPVGIDEGNYHLSESPSLSSSDLRDNCGVVDSDESDKNWKVTISLSTAAINCEINLDSLANQFSMKPSIV